MITSLDFPRVLSTANIVIGQNQNIHLIEIKEIEPQASLKTPLGGSKNAFLNTLVSQGIIIETDYRFSKDFDGRKLLLLEKEQEEMVRFFLQSVLTPTLVSGETGSFPVEELLRYLCGDEKQNIEKVVIVGGFLKKVIASSKTFCEKILCSMGVQEIKKLPLTGILKWIEEIPLHDVDVRIFLKSEQDPKTVSARIVEFIQSKFKSFPSPYVIRKELFTKFCAIDIEKTELRVREQSEKWKLRRKVTNKLSYAVVTPKATTIFQGIKNPVEVEFLCVASLSRNHLCTHDAGFINISSTLKEKEFSEDLDVNNSKKLQLFPQTFIDILGGLIHVPDPYGIDPNGILMIFSGLLKGWVVAEPDSLMQTLCSRYVALRTSSIEEKNKILEIGKIQDDIVKCLNNHHKGNLDFRIFFMWHFLQGFQKNIVPEVLFQLFDTIVGIQPPTSRLATFLHAAVHLHRIPFDVIQSVMQMGALFALGKVDVEDLEAPLCMRRHSGSLFFQVKIKDAACSYILLPLPTKESFRVLQRYFSEYKSSKEVRKVLVGIFETICSYRSDQTFKVSSFEANCSIFPELKQFILEEAFSLFERQSSILGYIAYHLLLLGGAAVAEAVLIRFPDIWMKKQGKRARSLLFEDLQDTMRGSCFEKICDWKMETHLLQSKEGMSLFWPLALSRIEEPKVFPIVRILCRDALKLELKEEDFIKLCDIVLYLIPRDILEAQNIWNVLHARIPMTQKMISAEIAIIEKMCIAVNSQKKHEKYQGFFSNTCQAFEIFIGRIFQQKGFAKCVQDPQQQAFLTFIEIYFLEMPLERSIKLFLSCIECAVLPRQDVRTEKLWASLYFAGAIAISKNNEDFRIKSPSAMIKSYFEMKETDLIFGIIFIDFIEQYCSLRQVKKGYALAETLVKKEILEEGFKANLRRVLIKKCRQFVEAMKLQEKVRPLKLMLRLDLNEELCKFVVDGWLAQEFLNGGISIDDFREERAFPQLLEALEIYLVECDHSTLQKFDQDILRTLILKDQVLSKFPIKYFDYCSNSLIGGLKKTGLLNNKESLQWLNCMMNILPDESVEYFFEKVITGTLQHLFILKNKDIRWVIKYMLSHEKVKRHLPPDVLDKYRTSYFVFSAHLKHGYWIKSSEYLFGKFEHVKAQPKEWIEALIESISSFAHDPQLKHFSIKTWHKNECQHDLGAPFKKQVGSYIIFTESKERLFRHIDQLDASSSKKYQAQFLDKFLQKMAKLNVYLPQLADWIETEIESIIESPELDQHYEVVERYFFWISGYRTKRLEEHMNRVKKFVDVLKDKKFYETRPEKLVKVNLFLGRREAVDSKIFLDLMQSIFANDTDGAVNFALEMLLHHQTILKGGSVLEDLLQCYELFFEYLKKGPSVKVILDNPEIGKSYFLFEALGYFFTHQQKEIVCQWSSKDIIHISGNGFTSNLLFVVNKAINVFQYSKDLLYVGLSKINVMQPQALKKGGMEFAQRVYFGILDVLFRNQLFGKNDINSRRLRFAWLINFISQGESLGVFIGSKGHENYYNIIEKMIKEYIEVIGQSKDRNLRKLIEDTCLSICLKEDSRTLFGYSSLYKDLCVPLSKELKSKRIELLDQFFQKTWDVTRMQYISLIRLLYHNAQKIGVYGRKRQEKPKTFVG